MGDLLWQFLNSPVGLLLCGFVLTTVVGKFLATWYQSASKKQEIRFVQLHQDRLKAIRELHFRTVDVETALFDLLYKWRPIGLYPPEVDPKIVDHDVREFRKISEKYKIYFNLEICGLIDSLCKTFESTWRNMEGAIQNAHGQAPEFDEDAHKGVHISSHELREKLRKEFRKILGVK
jgi:hypothetical protein